MEPKFSSFPVEGLRFLRSLKRNNNREWFQEHKTIYESAVKQSLVALVEALAADFEKFAPEMVASQKASIYRIYRDTRFSKDKTPYKTHAAAVFPRKGLEKHSGAGFYLHIAPTELLIGGGLYMPAPHDLNAVRSHIADQTDEFLSIIQGREFKKTFGQVAGEQLSRAPRGFPPDHPAADYLRHKQYLASRTLEPDKATSPRFYRIVVETFQTLLPLIRFLNEPLIRAGRARERQQALLS